MRGAPKPSNGKNRVSRKINGLAFQCGIADARKLADLLAFPPRARARGAKTPSGANLTSSPGERPDSLNKNSSPERNQGATFTLAKNRTERSGLQMPM
jgi:hypothetical protein